MRRILISTIVLITVTLSGCTAEEVEETYKEAQNEWKEGVENWESGQSDNTNNNTQENNTTQEQNSTNESQTEQQSKPQPKAPVITFEKQDQQILVSKISGTHNWNNLTINATNGNYSFNGETWHNINNSTIQNNNEIVIGDKIYICNHGDELHVRIYHPESQTEMFGVHFSVTKNC